MKQVMAQYFLFNTLGCQSKSLRQKQMVYSFIELLQDLMGTFKAPYTGMDIVLSFPKQKIYGGGEGVNSPLVIAPFLSHFCARMSVEKMPLNVLLVSVLRAFMNAQKQNRALDFWSRLNKLGCLYSAVQNFYL